jgi:hypothetical protein
MMGNGLGNIIAAAILAGAIVWTGGFGNKNKPLDEKQIAELYARAVGDIRNDIVINCGCCGEGEPRKADRSF